MPTLLRSERAGVHVGQEWIRRVGTRRQERCSPAVSQASHLFKVQVHQGYRVWRRAHPCNHRSALISALLCHRLTNRSPWCRNRRWHRVWLGQRSHRPIGLGRSKHPLAARPDQGTKENARGTDRCRLRTHDRGPQCVSAPVLRRRGTHQKNTRAESGEVMVFGGGELGQLGTGMRRDLLVPTKLQAMPAIVQAQATPPSASLSIFPAPYRLVSNPAPNKTKLRRRHAAIVTRRS